MEIYATRTNWSGTSYRVTLEPKSFVLVETLREEDVVDMRKFLLGDTAVAYTTAGGYVVLGRIETIGKKTITLRDRGGDSKRVNPHTFASYNCDYDLAKIKADNYAAMMNT